MKINGLPCPVCCETQFQNLTILRDTLVAVTTKCITCPLCEEQLSGLDKFTIHLFTHKNDPHIIEEQQNTLHSNECNVEPEHIFTVTSPLVAEEYSQETYIVTPVQKSSTNMCKVIATEKSIRCDICNISFSDTNILDMHKNLLHTNGFSCHLCHKRFKMQGSLMVHMRVAHYGFGQALGNNRTSKDEVQQIIPLAPTHTVVDNKQWECDVCLKKFTTKYFLKKHKRLHTGEMPYVCGLCGKSFTFQQSYHKHMLYHSEDKPHSCSECGRAFKELSTLHNHQRIHSGERPFACETCGKCFRQRVSYLVHRRIHTGAMPYKCTSCDKRFRYKVSQRTHKCKAQPPGAVVRQFGDLVQRLLLQQSVQPAPATITNDSIDTEIQVQETNSNEQCSTINEECLKRLLYDADVS